MRGSARGMHVGPCAEGGSGRARLVGMDTSSSSWLCLTVGTVRYYLYILFFLYRHVCILLPLSFRRIAFTCQTPTHHTRQRPDAGDAQGSIHPVTSLARANPSIHAHGVSNYLGHHCVEKKTCGEKKVSMHSYMPRREKPRVVE